MGVGATGASNLGDAELVPNINVRVLLLGGEGAEKMRICLFPLLLLSCAFQELEQQQTAAQPTC